MDPNEEVKDVQRFNQELCSAIDGAGEGPVKEASAPSSKMIRRKLRENGFLRHVLPPETVGTKDLHKVLEHDQPVIIEDMEPDSPGAKTVPFHDGPDIAFYRGDTVIWMFVPPCIIALSFPVGDKQVVSYRPKPRPAKSDVSGTTEIGPNHM